MTMVETWCVIPRHPKYEVSDWGNIRARGYTKLKATGMVGPRRNYVGVQLSNPDYMPAREHRHSLARDGVPLADIERIMAERRTDRMVHERVHRLVLEAFIGPCPDGMVGCHTDGDPLNNRLDNLRWDTPSNNNRDKRAHGTDHQVNKDRCPRGHEYTSDNVYENLQGRKCKQCARDRATNQGAPVNPRSHCRNGLHEMSGDNIRMNGNARKCRACENARRNRRYAERKQSS